MSDVVIKAEGLGKKYVIGHQAKNGSYEALRDVLTHNVRSMWHKTKDLFRGDIPVQGDSREDIWALRDIGFEIRQGEVVGIIGRNGSGKSTLLKILSRITEPTEGRVSIRGRVSSLLEVGTGFHPELTGRENIFLNGAILGMARAEIRRKFDEIVAFAEIEKFLDTPVKRYSSGMYVRLAFAVAAHLDPEILLVDEVLAVGDAEFQKKCLGKMQDVSRSGRTVLFVSHNMGAIEALCSKAVYLFEGVLKAIGDPDELVKQYLINTRVDQGLDANPVRLNGGLELRRFDLSPSSVKNGGQLRFRIVLHAEEPVRLTDLSVLIYSSQGVRVAILDLRPWGLPVNMSANDTWHVEGDVAMLPLVEGEYRLGIYANIGKIDEDVFDLATLTVVGHNGQSDHVPYLAMYRGLVELNFTAQLRYSAPV
jgi:lipopolysaccharide transport system ATP-binding protein